MGLEEDISKIENKVNKQSVAMEMLTFAKEQAKEQNERLENNNKRMFKIWIITFIGLLLSVGYILYLLNDISSVETDTIEIQDVETIDNSHIKIGDDIWEKSE